MSKKVKIIVAAVISVILVAVLVLVIIEETGKRTIRIANNTDKNIISLKVMFETEETSEELYTLYEGSLKSKDSYKGSFDTMDFSTEAADIGMLVTFDGEDEIFVYDGFFPDRFDGTIDIEFYQADGKYRVGMKAYSGLFKNEAKTGMKDDDYYFSFEDSEFYSEEDDFLDWSEEDEDDIDWDEPLEDDEDDEEDEEGDEYDDLFDEDD